jgi:flagellar hook-associated protein 2
MSIAPLVFAGNRTFPDDVQKVLSRTLRSASIPLTGLQNQQTDLLSRKQLLSDLRTSVAELGASVGSLGSLGESKAVQASVSNAARVGVSVDRPVSPGAHTISDIASLAIAASTTSVFGYADADSLAVSSDGILELTVGDQTYTVDLTVAGQNNLNGLRDAINGLGAGVSAAVLNTGAGDTPYYLSLAASASGLKALELRETAGRANSNLVANRLPAANSVFTSNSGFATPDATAVSTGGMLQLPVGGATHDFTAANTLEGVRDAINGLAGAGVRAEIVDAGGDAGVTRYRLKLTSVNGLAVELRTVAGVSDSNLLTGAHQGANAVFKLDGLNVVKADNVVADVVPGLTITILSTTSPSERVTIALSSSRDTLAGALGDLAAKYNAAAAKVNAQFGSTAGLLRSGDSIVRETQAALRSLTTHAGGGAIPSLAALGIRLDNSGVMSFDSATLYALSDSELDSALDFLGSASAGLGTAAANLTSISDPLTGLVKLRQDQYDAADRRLRIQIDDISTRIGLMQTGLSRQLQQADALLASLESQQSMLDAGIQGLHLALFGRPAG